MWHAFQKRLARCHRQYIPSTAVAHDRHFLEEVGAAASGEKIGDFARHKDWIAPTLEQFGNHHPRVATPRLTAGHASRSGPIGLEPIPILGAIPILHEVHHVERPAVIGVHERLKCPPLLGIRLLHLLVFPMQKRCGLPGLESLREPRLVPHEKGSIDPSEYAQKNHSITFLVRRLFFQRIARSTALYRSLLAGAISQPLHLNDIAFLAFFRFVTQTKCSFLKAYRPCLNR